MQAMTIKPILFSSEMARAILEGRKTVTRRVVKPQPLDRPMVFDDDEEGINIVCHIAGKEVLYNYFPPYQPGDILWVRETWSISDGSYLYRAFPGVGMEPDKQDAAMREMGLKWRPSIFMPREAARIFLRVTGVRVERVQEITPQQAMAEGQPRCTGSITICGNSASCLSCEGSIGNARQWFLEVWNSTIKPKDLSAYGWDANPWVWVIEFERCEKPEGWPG